MSICQATIRHRSDSRLWRPAQTFGHAVFDLVVVANHPELIYRTANRANHADSFVFHWMLRVQIYRMEKEGGRQRHDRNRDEIRSRLSTKISIVHDTINASMCKVDEDDVLR